MDIDIDMTNCIRNQHRGHFSKRNTMEKRMSNRQKKERKPYLHKTKNGSKKNGTLNTNEGLTRKIK